MLKKLFFTAFVGLMMASCSSSVKSGAETDPPADPTPAAAADPAPAAADGVEVWKGGTIKPDAKLPLVIDFNAAWCGPCRSFAPVFDEAAKQFSGRARFLSVNVDDCPAAAEQFRVMSIPFIAVMHPDGRTVTVSGAMGMTQFSDWLDAALTR